MLFSPVTCKTLTRRSTISAVVQGHARGSGERTAVDVEMSGSTSQSEGYGLEICGCFGNARGGGIDNAIHIFGVGGHAQTRQCGEGTVRVAARYHYVIPRDSTRACHLCSDSLGGGSGYADDVECGDGYLRVSVGKYNRSHFQRV